MWEGLYWKMCWNNLFCKYHLSKKKIPKQKNTKQESPRQPNQLWGTANPSSRLEERSSVDPNACGTVLVLYFTWARHSHISRKPLRCPHMCKIPGPFQIMHHLTEQVMQGSSFNAEESCTKFLRRLSLFGDPGKHQPQPPRSTLAGTATSPTLSLWVPHLSTWTAAAILLL